MNQDNLDNRVYSRNILAKIRDGTYVTNLDEYKSMESHWITLYLNGYNLTYFNSFGVGHL